MSNDGRNPALLALQPLVGTWSVTLSNASFLDDPTVTMTGSTTIDWVDESFVGLRSAMDGHGDGPKPPDSFAVIGRNESVPEYTVLYADTRGVSRVYSMTFDGSTWTQERADPEFYQRFSGTLSNDGQSILARWDRSHDDGVTWIHDFDLTYHRTTTT